MAEYQFKDYRPEHAACVQVGFCTLCTRYVFVGAHISRKGTENVYREWILAGVCQGE